MSGPAPKRQKTALRFDVEDEALNDACVVIQDVKFYVSKQHLSMHSDYFKGMFYGSFAEKNQKEIVLQDVEDPMDFQKFLELINGVQCLTDDNIDGVSGLADMYCAEIARCLDFLNEKSLMSAREKFEIAVKYSFMKELKADIISAIRSPEELQDIVPEDIDQLDKETSNMLLKKSLELHSAPPAPTYNNPPANPAFNYPAADLLEPLLLVPAAEPPFNDVFVNAYAPMNNDLAPAPHPHNPLLDPVILEMDVERLRLLDQIRFINGLLN